MRANVRDIAIREIGCIVARKLGLGYVPCEKHHLLSTGRHGNGKRRGEKETIGLNPWSHRGQPFDGWSEERCREVFGPSYARQARAFREVFGADDELLEYQNELIVCWASSTYGRVA